MKLKSLTKLAAVSAVALGAAIHGIEGQAANEIGTPQVLTIAATVVNDLTLTKTNAAFKFSATGDATDVATATISAAGVKADDTGDGTGTGALSPASLVWDPTFVQVVPQIAITAAGGGDFVTNDLYAGVDTITPPTDLTCGGTIRLASIISDQTVPMNWARSSTGTITGNPGKGALVASATTIKFGIGLATAAGTTTGSYVTGACSGGAFGIVLDY